MVGNQVSGPGEPHPGSAPGSVPTVPPARAA